MIPESTIQEIRDRADIVALISRYVELKQAGRNWKGLCPFHDEKTPSFNVNPARRMYKCFGCGAAGDVFRFIMQLEGRNFPEVVRDLAERLRKTGYEVAITPFGWFSAWSIDVRGESLAKVFKHIE